VIGRARRASCITLPLAHSCPRSHAVCCDDCSLRTCIGRRAAGGACVRSQMRAQRCAACDGRDWRARLADSGARTVSPHSITANTRTRVVCVAFARAHQSRADAVRARARCWRRQAPAVSSACVISPRDTFARYFAYARDLCLDAIACSCRSTRLSARARRRCSRLPSATS
jgi:hypothetical protein